MDIEKLTDIGQLPEDQKELAELVGLEAYKKLVERYAGSPIYIQKADSVMKTVRDEEIRTRFDGSNYRELALAYDLAISTVREIVSARRRELLSAPMDGQLSFDDENFS